MPQELPRLVDMPQELLQLAELQHALALAGRVAARVAVGPARQAPLLETRRQKARWAATWCTP